MTYELKWVQIGKQFNEEMEQMFNSTRVGLLHIIIRQTYQQNIKNMTNQYNIFTQTQNIYGVGTNCYLNNLSYQEDPIDKFLNQEVFFQRNQQIKEIQDSNQITNIQLQQNHSSTQQIKETQPYGKKKSIFHNFQKHLITLIKKIIVFSTNQADQIQSQKLSVNLWNAFMKTRSFNKKILHMVFGVLQTNKLGEEFQRLAEQFPEFNNILRKNTIEQIVEAQTILRQQCISQSRQINKDAFKTNCHVNRFEQFYEYFQSFIHELISGPMTKRMTKTRKYGVVEKLKCPKKLQ